MLHSAKSRGLALAMATSVLVPSAAAAADVEIGTATRHGMQVAAVYIQPVTLEPTLPRRSATSDIHLEADVQATGDNRNGFSEGDWAPYLGIDYRIEKKGSGWTTRGTLTPMVAADGPHYAANIALDGPGEYHLSYQISPPPYQGLRRHTDKETGVAQWWRPFSVDWDFTFVGSAGKKGGY